MIQEKQLHIGKRNRHSPSEESESFLKGMTCFDPGLIGELSIEGPVTRTLIMLSWDCPRTKLGSLTICVRLSVDMNSCRLPDLRATDPDRIA